MMPLVTDEKVTPEERAKVARRTWQYLNVYRRQLFSAIGLVLVQGAANLAGPALVKYGIDAGVIHHSRPALDRATVLFAVSVVAAYIAGRAAILAIARVGESFLRDLRKRVFAHEMSLSLEFFERNRTGVLVSRMTADIDSLQDLIGQSITMLIMNAVLFVGAIVVMVGMSWQLALATLIVVPAVVRASQWFRRESNRAYLDVRETVGSTLTTFQEGLAGVRVSQAFNQEPKLGSRFHDVNEAQLKANMKTERIAAIYFPVVDISQGVAITMILVFGGFLASKDMLSVGTVAAFVLYLQNVFQPIEQLSQVFNSLQAGAASLKKVYALLDETATVNERPDAVDLPAGGSIEVDHVTFAYSAGADPVLSDVSISVAPGEKLALVGPTGAGKSTLAKLMARFYDPIDGVVRYGGIDLRDATLESLRQRIVVVPQEGFLFAGTVRDNLKVGRPGVTDAQIDEALGSIGILSHIAALPDGLDTEIRQRGTNLSAGERQLVSIARCALADPSVMVLDEATSSLDLGTELLIEQALEQLMVGRTVIMIAHRLSTAARADKVAVVDDGRIVEYGPHEELLAAGGAYARLFRAWEGSADPADVAVAR